MNFHAIITPIKQFTYPHVANPPTIDVHNNGIRDEILDIGYVFMICVKKEAYHKNFFPRNTSQSTKVIPLQLSDRSSNL